MVRGSRDRSGDTHDPDPGRCWPLHSAGTPPRAAARRLEPAAVVRCRTRSVAHPVDWATHRMGRQTTRAGLHPTVGPFVVAQRSEALSLRLTSSKAGEPAVSLASRPGHLSGAGTRALKDRLGASWPWTTTSRGSAINARPSGALDGVRWLVADHHEVRATVLAPDRLTPARSDGSVLAQ